MRMKKFLWWFVFDIIDPILSQFMLWYMRFIVVAVASVFIVHFLKVIFGIDLIAYFFQ